MKRPATVTSADRAVVRDLMVIMWNGRLDGYGWMTRSTRARGSGGRRHKKACVRLRDIAAQIFPFLGSQSTYYLVPTLRKSNKYLRRDFRDTRHFRDTRRKCGADFSVFEVGTTILFGLNFTQMK